MESLLSGRANEEKKNFDCHENTVIVTIGTRHNANLIETHKNLKPNYFAANGCHRRRSAHTHTHTQLKNV